MPDIQAQTADGVIHSFPDGTPPEVVNRAVNQYLASKTTDSLTRQTQATARAAGAPSGPAPVPLPGEGREIMGTKWPSPLAGRNEEVLGTPVAPLAVGALTAPRFVGGLAGQMGASAAAGAVSDNPWVRDISGLAGMLFGTGTGAAAEDMAGGARDFLGRNLRVAPTVESTNPATGTLGRAKTVSTLKPSVKAVANVGKMVGGPQIANALIPDYPEPIGPFRRVSGGPIPRTPQAKTVSLADTLMNQGASTSPATVAALPPIRISPEPVGVPGPSTSSGPVPTISIKGVGAPEESPGFSPNDLISRTRRISIPGEDLSPVDLKRAGDLTQAPLERLRTLAKFGDKLAQNELNRRLKN